MNCMRLSVPDDWSKADILRGTLRQIQTGTLPNSAASDYSWDVQMMGMKNLLGQLEAVKRMLDARKNRDRAGLRLVVIAPPLREGGQPSYTEPIEETASETSLRADLAPSHATVIAINGEEYGWGRERLHVPAMNFGLGSPSGRTPSAIAIAPPTRRRSRFARTATTDGSDGKRVL